PYRIADVFGLQGVGSASLLGKSFVLAGDINASGTATWNGGAGFVPIGAGWLPFTGTLDGQQHTIANLTIAPDDRDIRNVGLFGVIGPGGVVRDLNLQTISVTANSNPNVSAQSVGTLAGVNEGQIIHVSTSGAIDARNVPAGATVGGLVGENRNSDASAPGLITNSQAAVNVSVGDGTAGEGGNFNLAGGLVGLNTGEIRSSSASGRLQLTGDGFGVAGGFAGWNAGLISQGSASGDVAGGPGSIVGGFAGIN